MGFIELKQVGKIVKRRQLLHDVSADIPEGSITVLEGINGSGKTLILKAILGLINTSGKVIVNGKKMKLSLIHI